MIDFACDHCACRMSVPRSMVGQIETCPECGETVIVPLDHRIRACARCEALLNPNETTKVYLGQLVCEQCATYLERLEERELPAARHEEFAAPPQRSRLPRWLRNVIRAIRYNRKKHVPVHEFVGGLEDRWQRKLDHNSRRWFELHLTDVDLLHQMLCGQLRSGHDPVVDHSVRVLLQTDMFLYTFGLPPEVLKRDSAYEDVHREFTRRYPDAGLVIHYAFVAFDSNSAEPSIEPKSQPPPQSRAKDDDIPF